MSNNLLGSVTFQSALPIICVSRIMKIFLSYLSISLIEDPFHGDRLGLDIRSRARPSCNEDLRRFGKVLFKESLAQKQ